MPKSIFENMTYKLISILLVSILVGVLSLAANIILPASLGGWIGFVFGLVLWVLLAILFKSKPLNKFSWQDAFLLLAGIVIVNSFIALIYPPLVPFLASTENVAGFGVAAMLVFAELAFALQVTDKFFSGK